MKIPSKRLYIKIICFTVPLMIIIMAIPSMVVTRQVARLLETEMQTQVLETADKLLPYLQDGQFPADSLKDIFSSTTYQVMLYPDPDSLPITPKQRMLLQENDVTLINAVDYDGRFSAVLWCGDQYAVISVDMHGLLRKIGRADARVRTCSLGFCIVVLVLSGRWLVEPVMTIEKAAKRVAAGDFSVRVPTRKHRDEVGSLIDSFNAMAQELGDVEMLRSSFISDVSHEFKIPLTSISGYTKLLQDKCSPEEQLEYTQIIVEETAHLSTLVDNILTLNRLDKHAVAAHPAAVALAEQIRRALALYESIWTAKEIDFRFSLDEITIQGYGILLFQVWTNLIDNAIKFSSVGGHVELTLSPAEDSGVCVVISDSGCGIAQEQQLHIFDKFYQADHSRSTEGNGLGLSIAHRIVEIHGGSIAVESQPGNGSKFTILLRSVQ